MALAASVAAVIPIWIAPRYGAAGMFYTLALATIASLPLCLWLSGGESSQDRGSARVPPIFKTYGRATIPALVALVAAISFNAGVFAFWNFLERIGYAQGIDETFIGLSVSILSVMTIVTALIAAWLTDRVSARNLTLVGSAMILAGLFLTIDHGRTLYLVGATLFSAGWGVAQPAYCAIARRVDVSGRIFTASLAATGIGTAIGSALGGEIAASFGYLALAALSAAFFMAALAINGAALFSAKRHDVVA